jgi:hypothetical protein
MLDAGCWMLDTGCWMSKIRRGELDAGNWMLVTGLGAQCERWLVCSAILVMWPSVY